MTSVLIDGESLDSKNLFLWSKDEITRFSLSPRSKEKMQTSRSYIEGRLAAGEVMYGVNTGFGAFSSVRISDSEIEELQKNLIRSHSVGIGEAFTRTQTRAMMILRANALARGHSGIRPLVVEKILEFLNANIIPIIPSQGSVGASGDLAPLSHLALALIGEGQCWGHDQSPTPTSLVLQKHGIKPLELKAKEGLSLINGCQVMTALGLLSLSEARDLILLADIFGALSLEALRGSRKAFDPLISSVRPHLGEIKTAKNLLKILGAETEVSKSHMLCNKVQDAYSLRCMPAVHGSVKDGFNQILKTLDTESNSSTDNPLVFADSDKILSCGNFHGMPVAHAMDYGAILFSSLASISESRISKLINPALSDLPAFLAPQGGLHSGHMIVQVAAASLVSENKVLSHPASVDSIPTSADKEDHVSMGTIAARKFQKVIENANHVLAMEALSALQGLDFLKPLKSSPCLEALRELVRSQVPFADKDRVFSEDIKKISLLMRSKELIEVIEQHTGGLEC